ncbi:SGNH/GDSL hydrolase family protein [Streptomyces sp. NPDC048182]|uniref:SGNH/GDSL hydrolase family protein n=1 Tax=Streptomyces sp. NPDC048182 TaxID=3365507 RepID=UPI003720627D
MSRVRDGGADASPTKHRALLAAIVTLIVTISAAIYAGTATGNGARTRTALPDGRPPYGAAPASAGTWVGAWYAAPSEAEPGTAVTGMANRSVRNVLHASVGGNGARVTLSNLYGSSPLTVTHATVALAAGPGTAAAREGTLRPLTFAGSPRVTVPAGGQVTSDSAALAVPRGADVLVTTYSPTAAGPVTYHRVARQTSYLAAGDRAGDTSGLAYTVRTPFWRYVTALDVQSHEARGTVVALGDSITDGFASTMDANRRWPDVFAARLRAAAQAGDPDAPRYSVVNAGISGNRVLTSRGGRPADNPSALSRFSRDVLGRPNVKAVVIALGVNDVLNSPRLADRDKLLAGLRTLVAQAHARGIKVVGSTITPFGGYVRYTDAREEMRQQVNAEIRAGRVYDAVVDFDKVLRDPYDPRRLRAEYDSGDHVHPDDDGYARMGGALDPADLKGSVPVRL